MIVYQIKNLRFVLLLFLSFPVLGQSPSNTVSIHWTSPKKILDSLGYERNVLCFDLCSYSGKTHYLPVYEFSISGNVTEFKIISAVFENLTSDEQKIIPSSVSSLEPQIKIKYSKGNPFSIISIIPLKEDMGKITEKMLSFEYTYQRNFNRLPLSSDEKIPQKGLRIASSVSSSVLASGNWYKISVSNSGIYKIDHAFLKNTLGIDPSTVNPRHIKIYGNGGAMLPQKNDEPTHDDLVENAIYVQGENDGIFDPSDYILFYGQSPDTWTYNSTEGIFNHTKNIYSDVSCYFITIGPGNGLRVQDQANISGATQSISTFDERMFHQNDLYNILRSGREWYGELFDINSEHTFNFQVPGIASNTILRLTSSVMARSYASSSFNITLNNLSFSSSSTHNMMALNQLPYTIVGSVDRKIFSMNTNAINSASLAVKLTYNKGSYSTAVGHLNYLEINVKRNLQLYGNQTAFRSIESINHSISEFIINNVGNTSMIWDITNPLAPKNQTYTLTGTQASFSTYTDTIKEFIAFAGSSFESPTYVGPVANQNLHGINTPNLPDLIIVTHPTFLSAANRLGQFRKTNDQLEVEVVTTEQVYNEFSSGSQDITAIRNFVKMLYDRQSGTDSIRYLLLFGDASYDYKNRIGNSNFVPTYESRQSLHPIETYSSDDYFGFFDDYEGWWAEGSDPDQDTVDIGIGRLPVKSISEAEALVNKIIHYSTNSDNLSKWRNKITFFADDGDNNTHLKDAEEVSSIISSNHKNFNVHKIYLDAYPQIPSPGGETSPSAREAVNQAVEKGTFILNYSGHGSEYKLAQETLVDIPQINNWQNYNALTFFITATCEFGRYDDPLLVSGAESALLNTRGGAIALITTTRPVYAHTNKALNKAIYNNIFIPSGNIMPRLGDVMKKTKNDTENLKSGIINRNYALLGDPSLRLAYPQEKVVLTQINGKTISLNDTLKALSTVSIAGEIRNMSNVKINDFNGEVQVTIYDKESIIPTFGTEGSPSRTFSVMNNLIYEGPVSVTEGNFNFTFVVPKDISYQFDNGKISLYAKKNHSMLDASGYHTDIIIGGSDTSHTIDNTPPVIKLYMNDESFVFGGLTGANSLFIAKMRDDNGINIAGVGIGHEITAVLNNSNEVIVLNDHYTAKKDNYKEGTVEYPLKNLSPGNHSIKFKCWDTHNNSEEAYLEFIVANDQKIALEHVLNYPNPFSTHTTFHFDHNRSGDDLDIMIQVYTISGKLIKTLDGRVLASPSHISDLAWDGRDDFGDKIGKGIYVYKVSVRSLRDASQVHKYQKLVILN